MKRLFSGAIATVALPLAMMVVAASAALAGDIMVIKAFARASPTPNAVTGAAYVSVMNHGQDDRLTGVSSPAAKIAELHKSEVVNGVMKMFPAAPLDIPAHGMLEMKPGGYHIMLLGLKGPLKKGVTIDVILIFERNGELAVKVPVGDVAASAGAHDHGSGEASGG
jgi:copper(I)-binding protein